MKLSNFLRVLPLVRFVTSNAPTDAPTNFCADSALKFRVFDITVDPPSEFNVNCDFIKKLKLNKKLCKFKYFSSLKLISSLTKHCLFVSDRCSGKNFRQFFIHYPAHLF